MLYLTSLFTLGVANWTIVGSTNFDLTGSAFLVSSGSSGSLNLGPNREYWFEPEFGAHTFDHVADVNRILVLRSENYPQQNSGLFRVTSVNSGSASWTVDYRSPDDPPPESGSLQWYLFRSEGDHENDLPAFLSDGTGTGPGVYHGSGSAANNSRIIFQSTMSSSWQVRYCLESEDDLGASKAIAGAIMSIAPGFNGDSNGDFQVGGEHLHGAMHYNTDNVDFLNSTTGINPTNTSGRHRFYAWVEDEFPESFIFVTRDYEQGASDPAWAAFGFTEDETLPLPPKTIQRMFVWGMGKAGGNQDVALSWETTRSDVGSTTGNTLVGFDRWGRVTLGSVATWCFLSSQTSRLVSPRHSTQQTYGLTERSGLTHETELLPVDVMVGTWEQRRSTALTTIPATFLLAGHRLGRFPIARYGYVEDGDFVITENQGQRWLHTTDGVYLPWSGSIMP